MATMNNAKAKVQIQGHISAAFNIGSGVRQGDALSALIFNLILESAIGKLDKGGTIFNKSYQIIAYADDIAIVATNSRTLAETVIKLENEAAKVNLKINENKTKYLRMSRDERRRSAQNITIGEHNFQGVESFVYLGAIIRNDNSMQFCIQDRIQAGNRSYHANKKLLQCKLLSRQVKLTIYKTIIRPVVTYGCEAWTMTIADEAALRIFERKILRRILGAKRLENGEYMRRNNEELNMFIKNEDIVRFCKSQRLRWAGHVARFSEERAQHKIFMAKPYHNRARGRPRMRWIDNVESDTRTLGVRNWKLAAQERSNWRNVVKKAKAHIEL